MKRCMNIAHRGASAYAPENTMAAFELAVQMGADAIELDVQMTKDEHVVVMHDLSIDRTSNGTGFIRDMTYDELSRFNYTYKFKDQFEADKCTVLKLEQVIAFAKENGLYLNIETKDYTNPYGKVNALTAQLLRDYEYTDHALMASLNHSAVANVKKDFPEIQTAIAFITGIYDLPAYAKSCKADALHPISMMVNEVFMEMADASGLAVNAWTVDNLEELSRLKKLGVAGVMTNKPDVFHDVESI